MVITTNEVEGFIQVAGEMGGLTNIVVEDTRIVGVKLVGDGSHAVILPTRRTDARLDEILYDMENLWGGRSNLYHTQDNNPHRIKFAFRGKPGLVAALVSLGVDQKLLSAIKTAKVSEMKEFIDATAPKAIPENAEVAEIVLKLTSQSDRHTFKTKSIVLPEVTLTMEVQGTCPTYHVQGSAEVANKRYEVTSITTIQAALKLKAVRGNCDIRS